MALRSKMGAKGGKRGTTNPPKSRWPKEAANWSGKERAEHAKKLSEQYPHEDPEYGMPDGSE